MTYFLYHLLLLLASPFYVARVLWKNRGWKERFGISIPAGKDKHIIWIHAVSVGEVIASKPLISLINRELPDYEIVLSTVTKTGREMAEKLKEKPSHIFYFPFDFPFVVKRVLRKIRPSLIVLTETELWPNLLRYSEHFSIPVVLTNGTISSSSFTRYKKIRPLFKQILSKILFFCVQTQEDKDRLVHLEVAPEKIMVTGNTKFDLSFLNLDKEPLANWNIEGKSPVIVAGSTHAGEEEFLLESFRGIDEKFPEALLILAPRHPERVSEVENLIKEKGYSCVRRTKMNSSILKEKIILVDTIGELSKIYLAADIVFVGGSLVPIGGHNLLEPAFLSKPIITGPYTFKQNEMLELLKEGNGVIQVKSGNHLKETLLGLLSSPKEKEKLGENAKKIVLANQGATRKNLEVIEKVLRKI